MFYMLSGLTDHGAIIQWDTGPGTYTVLSYLLWPLYQHQVNTMFLFVIIYLEIIWYKPTTALTRAMCSHESVAYTPCKVFQFICKTCITVCT